MEFLITFHHLDHRKHNKIYLKWSCKAQALSTLSAPITPSIPNVFFNFKEVFAKKITTPLTTPRPST